MERKQYEMLYIVTLLFPVVIHFEYLKTLRVRCAFITHSRVRKTVCNIRLGTEEFLVFTASFILKNCMTHRGRVVSALHSRMHVYNRRFAYDASSPHRLARLFRRDS